MSILGRVNDPADLHKLSPEELTGLAGELRGVLIETVAKTGGHLAPSLGVVELTLGLHLALNSPQDKIVWDVGHQSYVHKLITGRREAFAHLREFGGIAGFPKRAESPHDVADTGHASTSISLALGLAKARDAAGENHAVVAVIGDGSLTGGLAYEGLNQAGHLKSDLIVILNDNKMSIGCNIGAISSYLDRIRLAPTLRQVQAGVEHGLQRIPAIGPLLLHAAENVRDAVKYVLIPGLFFEELGFKYIGPIDGHNIQTVARDVRLAKEIGGPVLIHTLTKKGAGYPPAEEKAEKFHGTAPFVVATGNPAKRSSRPTYTQVFGETLTELAAEDQSVVAITAAMAEGTGLDRFAKAYPDRFFDVGIAESHAVTFAAGLALGGRKPVVAIYSTFLQRAYDQILHDVALQGLHVIFAIDRGGLVGEDGPTHHGVFDLSYLRTVPGMVIMAPSDEGELRDMLRTALELSGPVAIRYPRGAGIGVSRKTSRRIDVGQAKVRRHGSQVLLAAIGRMVHQALDAADILREKGVEPTVLDARFLKPLDEITIGALAAQHELVVTLEDNNLCGGFGSAVAELLTAIQSPTKLVSLGLPDGFIEHGSVDDLFSHLGLDALSIARQVESALSPTLYPQAVPTLAPHG